VRTTRTRIELTSAHPEAQRRRHDRQPDRHRATSMIHDDDDLREIPFDTSRYSHTKITLKYLGDTLV